MKLLLSTNSWLYDIMLRSMPEWREHGIEVIYDIVLRSHEKYLRAHKAEIGAVRTQMFIDGILDRWAGADISDANIMALEKLYGLNLREGIIYDLSMAKYDAIYDDGARDEQFWRRYFVSALGYYADCLKAETPDFIFGEGPHGLGMKCLFSVAEKMEIPFFGIGGAYCPDKTMFVYGRNWRSPAMEFILNHPNLLSEQDFAEARRFEEKLREKPEVQYYQRFHGRKPRFFRFNPLRAGRILGRGFIRRAENVEERIARLVQSPGSELGHAAIVRTRKFLNWRFINSVGDQPHAGERYVTYYCHYQPEANTSVISPLFENQANTIENIAKSLPIGLKLYVKEHSTDLGNRGRQFYRDILRYPGVRIIHPRADGFKVLAGSEMVFTVSGSVTLEALSLNKPVGLFSSCWWRSLPNVYPINAPGEIPEALNWGTSHYEVTSEQRHNALAAYFRSLYPAFFSYPWLEDESLLSNREKRLIFVKGILRFIEDYQSNHWDNLIFLRTNALP